MLLRIGEAFGKGTKACILKMTQNDVNADEHDDFAGLQGESIKE